MGNAIEYIEWRGDLSFNESPFNLVDNLIFTQLSYFDFSGIVPENMDETVKLEEAFREYCKKGRRPAGAVFPEQLFEMFKKMSKCRRFSGLELTGYTAHIDESAEKQFAALCILFEKKVFVSFRGTDDTLVGWKEDFNLAFMERVPAQQEAVKYLDTVMRKIHFLPVYIAGHSKGGNLSIYSALHCKKIHKRRIRGIYSHDGPGFSEHIINSPEYKENESKILNILPEGSIIGLLLNHNKGNDIIVKSEHPVSVQHNPFTWEVMGNDFVRAKTLNKTSRRIDKVITSWFYNMKLSEREQFVEAIYELVTVSDAKTLTDIKEDKFGFIKALGKLSKESKKDISKNVGQLLEQVARSMLNK